MTLEAVLAVRRKQCVGMADNMITELKKTHSNDLVVSTMQRHKAVIEKSEFAWFNDDRAFKFVLNISVSHWVASVCFVHCWRLGNQSDIVHVSD